MSIEIAVIVWRRNAWLAADRPERGWRYRADDDALAEEATL